MPGKKKSHTPTLNSDSVAKHMQGLEQAHQRLSQNSAASETSQRTTGPTTFTPAPADDAESDSGLTTTAAPQKLNVEAT